MAIEFRCQNCQKLLRTADDTAGKRAQCPECGEVSTIPPPSALSETSAGIPPAPGGGSPFVGGGPGQAGAGGQNPFASPRAPSYGPDGPRGQVDVGDIFARTWTIFKDQFAMCILAAVVLIAIGGSTGFAVAMTASIIDEITRSDEMVMLFTVVAQVGLFVLNGWVTAGQVIFFLKIARGQRAELSDLFAGGPYLLSVLGASILFGLAVWVGLILCIVPGIILALMFSQYWFLIVDQKTRAIDSLGASAELTRGNRLMLFLTYLLAIVVTSVITICTCGLGIVVAAPLMHLMCAVIYLTLIGQPTAEAMGYPRQGPPGPGASQ